MRITTLAGKHCFITGAASGIGRATAALAAREGAVLFLTDVNAAGLAETAVALRAAGADVRDASALDIADFAAVQALARQLQAAHGAMDVLMNIAGVSAWGAAEELEHRVWRQMIEVNLMGPIHVLEGFLPGMVAAEKGGHVVNVASAAGLFGLPWHAAYSASKFGLRGVSEVLRFDLRRHGIGVSLVCPGAVDTGLVRTIQVTGIDMAHPAAQKLKQRFVRHAVSPEKAAAAIVNGIKANRYMVFTSPDIAVGYWFQRKFAWPYEMAMRLLNNQLYKVAVQARKPAR